MTDFALGDSTRGWTPYQSEAPQTLVLWLYVEIAEINDLAVTWGAKVFLLWYAWCGLRRLVRCNFLGQVHGQGWSQIVFCPTTGVDCLVHKFLNFVHRSSRQVIQQNPCPLSSKIPQHLLSGATTPCQFLNDAYMDVNPPCYIARRADLPIMSSLSASNVLSSINICILPSGNIPFFKCKLPKALQLYNFPTLILMVTQMHV